MTSQYTENATPPEMASLFARKGEAIPVGGRPIRTRAITMRRPEGAPEEPARLSGALIAAGRNAIHALRVDEHGDAASPPVPANRIDSPAGIAAIERAPGQADLGLFVRPIMGPVAHEALAPAMTAAKTAAATARTNPRPANSPSKTYAASPVRPVLPSSLNRSEYVRSTLRLDSELRARLQRFADSETLSVQTLVTRALEGFLPSLRVLGATEGATGAVNAAKRKDQKRSPSVRRSIRFGRNLHWRLKTAAAAHRRSMQSVMAEALNAYLDAMEAPNLSAENGAERPARGRDAWPVNGHRQDAITPRSPQQPRLVSTAASVHRPCTV